MTANGSLLSGLTPSGRIEVASARQTKVPACPPHRVTDDYMHDGRPYIVLPIGSLDSAGEWIALALP